MKNIKRFQYFFIFLFIGIIIFFYPMFLSNFNLLPGNNIDSRFLNYVLEHMFLWLQQIAPHQNFWDMPVLYPNKNTLAYSDLLLGYEFIYAPLRLFFKPNLSFGLMTLIICFFNFLSFYVFLKKILKFNDLSSATGAFFFSFSLIRHCQFIHIQLLSQFYTILALICFGLYKKNKLYSILGTFFIAIQFYTSFYLGYFLFFALIVGIFLSLLFKNLRKILIKFVKQEWKTILINLLILNILLIPLAYHYLILNISKFPIEIMHLLAFPLKNYLLNESFIDNLILLKGKNLNPDEIYGIGIITNLVILFFIFKLKEFKGILLSFICIIYMTVSVPFIYDTIYNYIPAGGAIRAIGRYINILCPIFAIILANGINIEKNKIIKILIILFIVLEQIPAQTNFLWDVKTEEKNLSKYEIPSSCNVIFMNYSHISPNENLLLDKIEIDGMWLALKNRIYTVNGYNIISNTRPYVKLKPECIIELK